MTAVNRRLATLVVLSLVASIPSCRKPATESLGPSQAVAPGSTAPSPEPSSVASPSPTATPPPAVPQDEPEPEPSPDCIHGSDHSVDSASLAIYSLECNGERIPGSKDMTQVP